MSDIEKGIELELKQFKGHYINLVKCEKKIFRSRSWVQQELQKIIEKLANL